MKKPKLDLNAVAEEFEMIGTGIYSFYRGCSSAKISN
jgi:hypothetical protein